MERTAELLEELRRYHPADALEAHHHRAILDLLGSGAAAFSRDHFVPGHITASCFIVDPVSRRVLLHHHRRLDRWLQMGGHVEPDESTLDAALREGVEESGLHDLELLRNDVIDLDVHDIPAGKGEPEHAHFDVRYVARTSRPHTIIVDRAESNELSWVELDRAIVMMNEPGSQRVIMKIRKLM
jgi:8-oxo-dGTP pyrophosphatase MutT (NUDIX family)